jgi:DNA polymerase-4
MLKLEARGGSYRLIGAGLADLVEADDAPEDLFDRAETRARATERSMDKLRARFGRDAVVSGRALKRPD